MNLTTSEAVIVAKLKSQGCELAAQFCTPISLAFRLKGIVFFVPREPKTGYVPVHYIRIQEEVERWGLELLPLDLHVL